METSYISKTAITKGEAVQGKDIRIGILELLHKDFPSFNDEDFISLDELNQYRRVDLRMYNLKA